MNSRERVMMALNHQEPDRVPLDLGGSVVTCMHASIVYKLRQALGLDAPGTPVKVVDSYQLLGEIKPDLQAALGVDVATIRGPRTMFGFKNEDWKEWKLFDGTPLLVPGAFNIDPELNGDILMYPEGDKSAPPSGRMPKNGWYFDVINRQLPIDDDNLNPEDNLEEFGPISDEDLTHYTNLAKTLYKETDQAIFADFGFTGFGDIALVPAPWRKNPPKGIRGVEEWYMSTVIRQDYVYEVFDRQCDIALGSLEKLYERVGNRISVILVSAADFGMQHGLLVSPKTYRELFQPFHIRLNNWIYENTEWKTFIHSCGSVISIIDDFIDAGFDILNPVQCSAALMDPRELKSRFGDRISFWGGGVDTQQTLPNGTPDDVRREVLERLKIFGPGGGFVFNTIHNVQPKTPIENVLAMYETVREHGHYPLS